MRDPKDIIINGRRLSEILALHKEWLLDEVGGERANLSCADLRSADLSYANLSCADLRFANLRDANLSSANLRSADLSYAFLSSANLSDANLRDAEGTEWLYAVTKILPDGDIIGWKKCNQGVIVQLLVPADAKRSNAAGRKCRAEFAQVLACYKNGNDLPLDYVAVTDEHGPRTEYKAGEIVRADKWDENRWEECSNGIHFFITRWEAENY